MRQIIRYILSSIAAGVIPPAFLYGVLRYQQFKEYPTDVLPPGDYLVWMCLIGLFFATLVTTPLFKVTEVNYRLTFLAALLIGVVQGLIPVLILCALRYMVDGRFSTEIDWALWADGLSVLGSISGWLVWRLWGKKVVITRSLK